MGLRRAWGVFWRQIFATKRIVATFSVLLVAIVAAVWLHSDPAFRWLGLSLQLAGVWTVVKDIDDRRVAHGLPGVMDRVKAWLGGFRAMWAKPVSASLNATLEAVSSAATAELLTGLGPNATLEQRVQRLRDDVDALEVKLNETRAKAMEGIRENAQAIQDEAAARMTEFAKLNGLLKTVHVGGIDVSLMGVVWLAIGLIMSTGSVELARWAEVLVG